MSRATSINNLFEVLQGVGINVAKLRHHLSGTTHKWEYAETIAGAPYTFELELLKDGTMWVVFRRNQTTYQAYNQPRGQITPGDVREVMQALNITIGLIRYVIKLGDPVVYRIRFSADKSEPSRIKLYDRMIPKLAQTVGGRVHRNDSPAMIVYTVVLREQREMDRGNQPDMRGQGGSPRTIPPHIRDTLSRYLSR